MEGTLKLSTSDVEYVAKLARLEITEAEKQKFTAQLNDILLYIDQLNELDTTGVAPMSHAIAVTNAFREDRLWNRLAPKRRWPTRRTRAESFSGFPKSSSDQVGGKSHKRSEIFHYEQICIN
jgi:aspartyl-tRNA(Asn)/glutamyl-tRNA(Gln) amidotransferase subunit C